MVYFPYIPECKGGLRMAYASSIDFSDGLALNGNDPSFYLAHLRRFAKDTSLLPLSDALTQGDVHQAFCLRTRSRGFPRSWPSPASIAPPPCSAIFCATAAQTVCRRRRRRSLRWSPGLKKRVRRSIGIDVRPSPLRRTCQAPNRSVFCFLRKKGQFRPSFVYISVSKRGKRALPPPAVNPFVFLPPLWYHNRD